MTAIRPAVRDVLRGVVIAAMVLAMIGTTLALRSMADDAPYTLTRDGIQLAQPFEDNAHLNVRTDAGTTFNIHAESKCITRTDAECAGQRHEIAQYIGQSFIPWSVIGVPDDACVVWLQRSGANFHYGAQGEPPFCLTEEEPCPDPSDPTEPTPSTPTTDPTTTPTTPAPSATPDPTPSPSATGGPSASPSPHPSDPALSGSPTSPATSPEPVSTDPTATSAVLSQSDTATGARSAGTTPTTDPTARDVLASSGLPTEWLVYGLIIGVVAIIVGAWLLHLVHPKRGDE